MRRFLFLVLIVPLAILLIVLSVANRATVTLSLDPLGAPDPTISLTGPLFVFLFAALLLGVLIGGTAAWIRQGRWRQTVRRERDNAARLQREIDQIRAAREASDGAILPPPPVGII